MPGIRVVPNETIPDYVYQYLVPSEKQVVTVRYHPAVLFPPALLLLADVTAFALGVADVISVGWVVLAILGILFPVSCYFLYRSVLAWLRTYFVLTSSRVILINWKWKRRLIVIPINEADDMSLIRTLPGRLFGYGSFSIRRSGRRGHARKIRYMPYPEQVYLEVCGMIFPER